MGLKQSGVRNIMICGIEGAGKTALLYNTVNFLKPVDGGKSKEDDFKENLVECQPTFGSYYH
jgi:ABC-type Mn2+/Zn2+ transport system ATPase subunit